MTRPSSASPVEIVAIDDDPVLVEFLERTLRQPGVNVMTSSNSFAGWELVRSTRPDIVILDQVMPELSGMELLARIVEWDPGIDVILLSGEDSIDLAVEAIQKGACDFLSKPITSIALRERLAPLIAAVEKRRNIGLLEGELLTASKFGDMIGRSAAMLEVFALMQRVAPHFRSILVHGATGTGKELVSRALHQMSPARTRPFVVCNCAAIVETLFESELFGHVRGSFTGATQDRAGLFEAADGGTLFLDEIGEVPLKMQAKFLRALQSGDIQRVGSTVTRKVSVKVIAATNRDLRAMVKEHEFREDLFYRLTMLEIKLPRLADRKEDLPLLYKHFVETFAHQLGKEVKGLTRRAQALLSRSSWPGNIRELENVMWHACMMARSDLIDIEDLPEYVRAPGQGNGDPEQMTLEEVEHRHVRRVLESVGGNKQVAAEILGISRATLYRVLGKKEPDKPAAD